MLPENTSWTRRPASLNASRHASRNGSAAAPWSCAVSPEQIRQLELCRLARTDLQCQLEATAHDVRRTQLTAALAELDRRIATLSA